MLLFLVPLKAGRGPCFVRGDLRTIPLKDLAGPYLEYMNENFTCDMRHVLPGKDNTLFEFYYNGKLRLQSNKVGEIIEVGEKDQTKHVVWIFSTSFKRSDNGGKMRCIMNWEAGQYSRTRLMSELTENVEVTCKYSMI